MTFAASRQIGVTLAATGDLIAAVPGKSIRVTGVALVALGATAVTFRSATTNISGQFNLAATGGLVLPEAPSGWFTTAQGEALNLLIGTSTTVGASIIYELL